MKHPSILRHLQSQLPLKIFLYVALTLLFCIPYFFIGHHPWRTPSTLPATFLDREIPFDPRWVYMYQSLYLLIPIAPFLAISRRELLNYAKAFILLTVIGLSICLLFPTRCPRPLESSAGGLYGILLAYDPPTNAFPSMHIALASQSLLFGIHLLRAASSRLLWPLSIAGAIWLFAIAYSTIATRQHYAIDLPAGFLLALVIHFCIFRRRTA